MGLAAAEISGFDSSKATAENEKQTITVTYKEKTATFEITIKEVAAPAVTSIILTPPTKTSYKYGENLVLTGGKLTVQYDNGKLEEIALMDKRVTVSGYDKNKSGEQQVTFTFGGQKATYVFTVAAKPSSGGSSSGGSRPSGGSSGGSSYTVTDEPTVDGKEKSWTDVAKDIEKLPAGKEMTIELNGDKKIPADVIKAIAKANAKVNVKVDDVFSWTIDGSEINEKDAKAIDLTVAKVSVSGTSALRGALGTSFKLNGTNAESELNIKFKSTHAGKFANVFKKVDGKLVFVDNVKIDKDGNAVGLDISEKGEYVVMLGEFSDRAGDMNNDGILNAKDALAVLKDSAKLEKGANPLVSDLNGDGYRNAKDALIILKMAAGLL
ncbi:MAG TPA: hypothetical protein DER68_00580 [Ruminococcaceae bacterium]|nr:hypothetical protein [Oscillospiraceae bacterium]